MEELKVMLIVMLIAFVLLGVYTLLIKYESKRIYKISEFKPQRIDERGKDLCFCTSFCSWQQKKLQLIKEYYKIDSIIEDENWKVDYKITDIRGPYKKVGSVFEYELEFKVISVQAQDEIVVRGSYVKIYDECKFRFDIESYIDELQDIYWHFCQQGFNVEDITDLFDKLYYMRNTNLMRYGELVKIKEIIEEGIDEADKKNIGIYNFLSELAEWGENCKHNGITVIQEGGQLNLAQDEGKIEATQNMYVENKSNFSKRLDELINIMNKSRESYEEPITVGYICEYLGYESENELRQYYVSTQEPNREFMESLAEQLGVNKKWLAKGAAVPIFDVEERRNDLSDILREVPNSESMYIVIGKEGYGNCLLIILKYNDIKYICYKQSFIFYLSSGAGGQTQLMQVYDFFQKVSRMKNREGKAIYPSLAYFSSEEQWLKLKQGKIYPAEIRKIKEHKPYIMEDFLDINNLYRAKEQYRIWYGREFVECQEYIRNRLIMESRDYI